MRSSPLVALAALLSAASAQYQGFNYGSTRSDGYVPRTQADFEGLFSTAKNLVGTNGGFTSARLYTMIQAGTAADVTSAIPAAIAQGTHLLLGLWASGPIDNEITALKQAIAQYGSSFTSLVAGISVGSEDLYRNSPTGIEAGSTVGADPQTIVNYINEVRSIISGTGLSKVPVGHVDTWTAWVNGTNQPVIDACDFIGMDAYPYFQNTMANSIDNGPSLFQDALSATQAAVGGKDVWITETGWPVSGKTENLGVPSTANAKTYWDAVGCPRFGKVSIFWYTIEDTDNGATPNPSFGVAPGSPLSSTPLYDLSCSAVSSSSSTQGSSTAKASSTATTASSGAGSKSGSGAATTATGSAISSAASSVSTAATGGQVASSGDQLAPSKGPGSGYGSGSNSTATVTGSSGSGSSGNATRLSTTSKPTGTSGSSASSTSGVTQASANAGVISGSAVVGVLGGLLVALAAL